MSDPENRFDLLLNAPARLLVAALACEAKYRRKDFRLPRGHRDATKASRDFRKAIAVAYEFCQGRVPSKLSPRAGLAGIFNDASARNALSCIRLRLAYPTPRQRHAEIDRWNYGDLYAPDAPTNDELYAASKAASFAAAAAYVVDFVGMHEIDPVEVNGDSYLKRIPREVRTRLMTADFQWMNWSQFRTRVQSTDKRFPELGAVIDPDQLR